MKEQKEAAIDIPQFASPIDPGEPANTAILQKQISATNEAIQVLTSQMHLQNARKVRMPKQETISLISGNNHNQTIKRAPPYSQKKREDTSNERTKDEIRMKLILQNSRLKTSLQSLKQDIDSYRQNELKIVEVLRESKTKLAEYKTKLKAKSKRITELTDANVALKQTISIMQSKINQVGSFSQWQTKEIQHLNKVIAEKALQSQQTNAKLHALLKINEEQLSVKQIDEATDNLASSPQQLSSKSMNEHTPFSMKEMSIQQLEGIKQRQYDDEQSQLKEAYIHLKHRIMEVETELDYMRTEKKEKERIILMAQQAKDKEESHLKEEIESVMEKSMQVSQRLQEKENSLGFKEKELENLKMVIKAAQQQSKAKEQKLKTENAALKEMIEQKQQEIMDLSEQLQEKDNMFKRQLQEIQMQIEGKQEEHLSIMKQFQIKNQELIQSLQSNQSKMEELIAQNEELLTFKEENQDKISQALSILAERKLSEQMLNRLRQQVEYYKKLPEENEHFYQQKLTETDNHIKTLLKEKNELMKELQKYTIQMRTLKNQIAELNREKNDRLGSHSSYHLVIEQQKQEEEKAIKGDTSFINEDPAKIAKTQSYEDFVPVFESRPLDEPEQLAEQQEEDYEVILQEKQNKIKQLQKQIEELKHNFATRLERQVNGHIIQAVQTNYKLQKQQQQERQLKAKLDEAQKELTQANNDIVAKMFELEIKEDAIYRSQRMISEKEELIGEIKRVADKKDEEINHQAELIEKLEQHLESQRSRNKQSNSKIILLIQDKTDADGLLLRQKEVSKKLVQQLFTKTDECDKALQKQKHQEEELATLKSEKRVIEQKIVQLNNHIEKIEQLRKEEIGQSKAIWNEREILLKNLQEKDNVLASKTRQSQALAEKLGKSTKFERQTKVEIEEKLAILTSIIDEQKSQIERITHQKMDCMNEVLLLRKQNDEARAKMVEQSKISEGLKGEISRFHDEFDYHIEENNALKDKIVECQSQIRRMKTERDDLLKEKIQLGSRLEKSQKLIKDFSSNIASLKESLELSRSQAEERVSLSDSPNKDNEESISLKLEEGDTSRNGIVGLKQQITQIQQKHRSVVAVYEQKIRSTSVKFQEIAQQKESKILQLQSSLASLKAELIDLSQSKEGQQTIIKQLRQAVTDHMGTISRLEAQLTQQKELLSSNGLIISSLEKQQNLKKQEIEQLNVALQQLQQKNAAATASFQQKRAHLEIVQGKLSEKEIQQRILRQQFQARIKSLQQQVQVSRRLLQDAQEEHQMKVNKLGKELSNHRLLLEQAQKQSSFQLQQSNNSITEIKSQVKIYADTIKQKDHQIKELRETLGQTKEHYEKLKLNVSNFEGDKALLEKSKAEAYAKVAEIQEEANKLKEDVNRLRALADSQQSQISQLQLDLNRGQRANRQSREEIENLQAIKARLEMKIEKANQQKRELESRLQTIALQKSRLQTQCEQLQSERRDMLKKKQAEKEEMQTSSSQIIKQFQDLSIKYQQLKQENNELAEQKTRIHKQYQTRIQNLCLEQRGVLLDVENRHSKELQRVIDSNKERQKEAKQELQHLVQQVREKEKLIRQSENERGELTDKILQLTQQVNDTSEVIENLRNNVVAKGNEIDQCRQIIYKMQEQAEQLRMQKSPMNSSSSIPLSTDFEQKLVDAYETIDRVVLENNEIQLRQQKLIAQLQEKQKYEKELLEKIDKLKERQNRERNSSGDSWVSRSKIFDEKSQTMMMELQDLKNKLESAQAYILHLQSEQQRGVHENNSKKAEHLEHQVEELRLKVEQLEAYVRQLEEQLPPAMTSSIRSKRSVLSKAREDALSEGLAQKVALIADFVQSYAKGRSYNQRQEQLRSQLSHPALEELLSTIIYRLEKETAGLREKEMMIGQLQEECEALQSQTASLRQEIVILQRKRQMSEVLKRKNQQAEKLAQDLLTGKLKDEADLAECRSYIQQLENRLAKHDKNREEKRDKDTLEILQEEHESSSDSMMSESAQSQIPSSVNQSKEFKSSMDFRNHKKGELLSMSKSMLRAKSFNGNEEGQIQFLKKCLSSIKDLQAELERVEKDLEHKTKLLNHNLAQTFDREELLKQLSTLESRLRLSDRQFKNHCEASQIELANLLRELLRARQGQDKQVAQQEGRKRVEEYLGLIESERRGKEEDVRGHSPVRVGAGLHEIKEDAVNEDKGSSIVHQRGQVVRSFSNSEGVTQSLDLPQLRHNYNQVLKQLHEAHDELVNKRESIKMIKGKYTLVVEEVLSILDELRLSFEEDQYLFSQVEKIKQLLTKQLAEGLKEEGQQDQSTDNPFSQLMVIGQNQLRNFAESATNQQLKRLIRQLGEIMDERFQDCIDFLNSEKSLIGDILKIREKTQLEAAMERLAGRMTRHQIAEVIANSHNRTQAHRTLSGLIKEEDDRSLVSDEHDFSPDGDKIQQIRCLIYPKPTELSLQLHNQLLEILAAPTRQHFYSLIEDFYRILKDYEDRFDAQRSQMGEKSEKHSIRIRNALQLPPQHESMDFSIERGGMLEIKPQKNRSSSCRVGIVQENQK